MARAAGPATRIKVVIRRSSLLLKCVVLAALILCTVVVTMLFGTVQQQKAQAEALRQQAAQLEQENQKLEQDIAGLGTLEGIKQIAKEKLGLVEPGSWFFSLNK